MSPLGGHDRHLSMGRSLIQGSDNVVIRNVVN